MQRDFRDFSATHIVAAAVARQHKGQLISKQSFLRDGTKVCPWILFLNKNKEKSKK